MKNKPGIYLGLTQNEWDNLCSEAEEVFRDSNLGQHILGVYPYGDRIFGLENYKPGILCLYVDSVDPMINPAIKSTRDNEWKHYQTKNHEKIDFVNLFSWAKWVIDYDLLAQHGLLYAVPMGDAIYQDSSLSEILSLARSYLQCVKFHSASSRTQLNYLPIRVSYILATTGKYFPSINPAYGTVYTLSNLTDDKEILDLDKKIIDCYLGRGPDLNIEEERLLRWWAEGQSEFLAKEIDWKQGQGEKQAFGKAIANLYRYQL